MQKVRNPNVEIDVSIIEAKDLFEKMFTEKLVESESTRRHEDELIVIHIQTMSTKRRHPNRERQGEQVSINELPMRKAAGSWGLQNETWKQVDFIKAFDKVNRHFLLEKLCGNIDDK